MSAGTGVAHSDSTRPRQIRCTCIKYGCSGKNKVLAAYDQKNFSEAEKRGKLRLVASPDGRDGSVKDPQDNGCTQRFWARAKR